MRAATAGRVNEKHAPRPRRLSTHILPPKCSTIWRLMCRPSPLPCGLSVSVSPTWRNLLKIALVVLRRDAAAVVAHVDAQVAVAFGERDLDAAVRPVAELHRVRQQVEHHLDHAVEIGGHRRTPVRAGAPRR